MSDAWAREFATAEPMAVYDEVLVPRVFAPLAELLLDDLGVQPGERLLDVACGPGTVALAAARRGAQATGADVSPAMLDLARGKSDAIDWVEAPAAPLTGIADATFDVVACQQGLQFFPDRAAAVGEMHRALRPGGRVGIAVWAPLERSPAFAALGRIIHDVLGPDQAASYEAGPWALTDPDVVTNLLDEAGFHSIAAREHTVDAVFEGGRDQVTAILAVGPVGGEAAGVDRSSLHAAAELHLGPLADEEGGVRSPLVAHVVTAARP